MTEVVARDADYAFALQLYAEELAAVRDRPPATLSPSPPPLPRRGFPRSSLSPPPRTVDADLALALKLNEEEHEGVAPRRSLFV